MAKDGGAGVSKVGIHKLSRDDSMTEKSLACSSSASRENNQARWNVRFARWVCDRPALQEA